MIVLNHVVQVTVLLYTNEIVYYCLELSLSLKMQDFLNSIFSILGLEAAGFFVFVFSF